MTKRRDFIKTSVAGAAGLAIGGIGFNARSYASIVGANDRINLAVIGIRNQGTVHINSYCDLKNSKNVIVKTLCDADERLFPPAVEIVNQKTGIQPLAEWDLKRVLDDKEIHAVSIVTPNHWHALATIWASQAGKHVYVEKPASHNVWEGRKMIEAARKYDVRVQVGLNNRSSANVCEAIKFLHDGGIGEVFMARALCFKARDSYGMAKDRLPPATFHYDRWLGPGALSPVQRKTQSLQLALVLGHRKRRHRQHGAAPARSCPLGHEEERAPGFDPQCGGSLRVSPGGRQDRTPGNMVYGGVETYGHDKTTQETPNTQTAVYNYADGKIIEFETRGRYTNHEGSRARKSGTSSTVPRAGSKSAATPGKPFANGNESPSPDRRNDNRLGWRSLGEFP